MPIDDPLFAPANPHASQFVKPWWRHPALIIGLIALLAAILALLTNEPPDRQAATVEVEIPIEVHYSDEPTSSDAPSPGGDEGAPSVGP